ncbi:methyl-accepting chemotaxis protein [Spirulina sp. 06S082]|uniref:methyl-accepting chemotaxis protein n=1 Tax=Spirulina sp. 06S082 TaxID=3110248 RepID=UPI002B1F3EDF|nr:methyl-accepting chemotaxis protein [Spirulina sp. 06S082]MEA5467960.1 methyl-accepting chemotaxis protein [Spirulina sp. 06S082]
MAAPENMASFNLDSTRDLQKQTGFKLRHWIIVGYSVPIILSIISGVAVFVTVRILNQEAGHVSEKIGISAKIGDLAFHTQTLSRATRGYLLQKNSVSLQSYQEARNNIQSLSIELNDLIIDRQQKETFAQISQAIDRLRETNQELIDIVDRGQTEQAIQRWQTNQAGDRVEELLALLEVFRTREQEILNKSENHVQNTLNNLTIVAIMSVFLSLLLTVILGWWVITRATQKMNYTVSTLATSSSQIATTVEEQERTASSQAASVNETTTTMDELGASSRQSAEQAEAAANAAQQALSLADAGTQAVAQTLEGMNSLKDKVGAIALQILRLSEQTTEIGSISQLVSDLANQTNMLALNAAVEAVRAGEHGKGFSVVATEIRKLADRSKQSAQKINDLVSEIQRAINSTVMVTDEGTKTVENNVTIARETATSFSGVANAVNNVVLNNQQISLNIKQQAAAIQQVVQAMNAINQAAQESATGIGQTKLGTRKLNEATQILKEMI